MGAGMTEYLLGAQSWILGKKDWQSEMEQKFWEFDNQEPEKQDNDEIMLPSD